MKRNTDWLDWRPVLLRVLSANEIGEKGKKNSFRSRRDTCVLVLPLLSQTDDDCMESGECSIFNRRKPKLVIFMKVIFLHTNVASLTNIQWFNGSIDDKSQTCVSCMLSGAGRTEPQLGRLLLLDSTGTSGASCSALRMATSLSKYACHKTQHRITAFMHNEQTHTPTHHLVTCLWRPDRCEQSVIKKHVERNLCSPQSKEVAASTTVKHCPRVCPFIKNQCPTIQLPFLTRGNNVTQTLKFTHNIHCKRFTKNQVRAKPNVTALWKAPPSRCSWGKHRSLYANEDGKEQGSDYLKVGLVRLKCSV